jgi:hypothetical protein
MRRLLPLFFLFAPLTAAVAQQRGATIIAIAPTFGPPGTTVSIRGAGFAGFERGSHWVRDLATEPPPGIVEFNGVPGDVLFWQDDLITVKVPRHASTGVIRLILPESRAVLTGDVFDVYYSTADEAQRSESVQTEAWRVDGDRKAESRERPLFFDEQAPPVFQLYSNPWFSSLTPGERTFFSQNGLLFDNPFSLGRKGSLFLNGGLFPQRGIRGRSVFDRFRSEEFLFPDFSFRSSRNFGCRPFWFFFNTNHPSSFRNNGRNEGRHEGHIFRR